MDQVTHNPAVSNKSAQTAEIIALWREILERDAISAEDEFFDIGGNSMLLLAMLEIVQERFEREIQLDDLADGVTPQRIVELLA